MPAVMAAQGRAYPHARLKRLVGVPRPWRLLEVAELWPQLAAERASKKPAGTADSCPMPEFTQQRHLGRTDHWRPP
jgi:hypothetical protein